MRNNAPVEHCIAEAFILRREIVLTMKASVTLCVYLDLRHEYCAIKNKSLKNINFFQNPVDTQENLL